MIRRPPRSTRTDTLLPYTTLFRSDVDALARFRPPHGGVVGAVAGRGKGDHEMPALRFVRQARAQVVEQEIGIARIQCVEPAAVEFGERGLRLQRSEEHTSELQSLMRISYAVFCLKKKHKHKK